MVKQLLEGRRGLIMGVANKRSIAWGAASACAAHGAELAFTYQGDALRKRVAPLAESVGGKFLFPCDVADDASIHATFDALEKHWDTLDFVVHALAFADKEALQGRFVATNRAQFHQALDISCYSFLAVASRARALMKPGGSLITMTYIGAERVVPHYNLMGVAKAALEASTRYLAADLGVDGIRVNAVSAGPIRTLAASGISDFHYIIKWNAYNSPLQRNVTLEEIANSVLYLASDLSRAVTGEVHHVDNGYHIIGMKMPGAPDIEKVD